MRDAKETFDGTKVGGKNSGGKAYSSAPQEGKAEENLKYCHGSVCLGSQKPTNCICPMDKK